MILKKLHAKNVTIYASIALQGGWWYRHCHNANLNGEFKLGMTWFDNITRSWVHVSKSRMSLRRIAGNNKEKCKEKPITITDPISYSTVTPNVNIPLRYSTTMLSNIGKQEYTGLAKELPRDDTKNDIPGNFETHVSTGSNINDPLKKNIYFLNRVSPKHKPHTNQKMSSHHHNKDYPDTEVSYDDDEFFYYEK